jgi:hypothetical protein
MYAHFFSQYELVVGMYLFLCGRNCVCGGHFWAAKDVRVDVEPRIF